MKQIVFALLVPLLLVSTVLATGNAELEKEPFTEERFKELQEAGEVILVDVFADWCPTCARQQEILEQYRQDHPEKTFHIMEVNFDNNKEWVRHFRAPRQSTLLLFSGEEQYWFSVAETDPDVIAAELDKAIAAAN
ncbi:MAG: thioredoxin family protein [Balneolales bacterium]